MPDQPRSTPPDSPSVCVLGIGQMGMVCAAILSTPDRGRPAAPARVVCWGHSTDETGELSGSFDIELTRCEDAETGEPLGWPPEPLVLHGSFDRLRVGRGDAAAKRR